MPQSTALVHSLSEVSLTLLLAVSATVMGLGVHKVDLEREESMVAGSG